MLYFRSVWIHFLFFLLPVLLLVSLPGHAGTFQIEKGILDLRNWDPQRVPTIDLKGNAEFYWQQFVLSNPPAVAQEPAYLELSRPWTHDGRFQAAGFASYRVKILMPSRREQIQLYLVVPTTKARVYVDKVPVAEFGEPLASANSPGHDMPFSSRPRLVTVAAQGQDIDLVFEISNWEVSQAAGFWGHGPRIGLATELERQLIRHRSTDAAFLAICLIMAIYHVLLFVLRREDKSNIVFTCMGISAAAHFAVVSDFGASLELFHPLISFRVRYGFYNLGWFFSMTGLFYFAALIFPNEVRMKGAHAFAALTVVFSLVAVLFHSLTFLQLVPIYQISVFAVMVYIVTAIVKAVRNKRSGARVFLMAMGIMTLSIIHDLLNASGLIHSVPMVMYSTLLFLLCQSALLSMRFAEAFRQVQILSDEIIEKEKARTVFFHNTSHELRTPLNGILGFLDLVRGGHYGPIPEKARIQIDKAWRLAESLKLQVNTILDLAKSKRGDLRSNVNSIDLAQFKKDCDVLAEGLQLKFPGTRFSSQLDDIAGTRYWHGDREKTLTIIRNLLGNAFKFRSPDRPNEVRLQLEHRQGELQIRVSDQGIGIAAEDQAKIFDEFSQAQSDARRSYEGTGLGLTMVRDLIKLAQGSIQVDSAPGRGSLFVVTLPEISAKDLSHDEMIQDAPIHVSEVKEEGQSIQSLASETSRSIREFASQYRLLIVDDNAGNLEVIQDVLGLDGYTIELADGGRKALQMLQESVPDLLILDLMMPEVSGEDVLRHIRSTPRLKDLPVIILTARASDQDRIVSLGLGADEYMSKPFDPRELSLRVYNTLERRELQRQALDDEHRQRLSELGQLFTDLSHELKNIFQLPHPDPQNLTKLYPRLWTRPDLTSELQTGLSKVMELPGRNFQRFSLFDQMQKRSLDRWPQENRRRAARILAFGPLDDAETLELWEQIKELPHSSFASLQDQMDMAEQYVALQDALYRGRDLALSALDLERMGHGQGKSLVKEVMASLQVLLQARLRKSGVELRCELPAIELPIAPGVLQQVLINVIANACDALANAPADQRWIEVCCGDDKDFNQLRIRNGGTKISTPVAKQIFHRGFSTKGQQGTGLGLALSRRLIKEQGGDLSLDLADDHTTFVISFAKQKEEKLA
jgi:signal transduction histidine kinase/DNA-binding NarL/FixJ family response regulator